MKKFNLNANVELLFNLFNKKEAMLSYISEKEMFRDILEASLDSEHVKAWRATSLLGHLMKNNDARVRSFTMNFIDLLAILKHEGHQRQILVVLDKMQLTKDQKGHLFNHALTIWEQVNTIPSTRSLAFKSMFKMSKSFPELKQELVLFTTEYYAQTLTSGIRVSFDRMVEKLKKDV